MKQIIKQGEIVKCEENDTNVEQIIKAWSKL